jgi:hypothetical protein
MESGAQLMKAMLLRQISILAFFIISLASAHAIDASDATRLSNLPRKILQLRKDITSVSRSQIGGQGYECLTELYNSLAIMYERMDKLRLMVTIARLMNDKSDKQTVVDMLSEEAAEVLKDLDVERSAINSTAGYCSWNNVAVAKAQEILSLYNETTTVVSSIMKVRR